LGIIPARTDQKAGVFGGKVKIVLRTIHVLNTVRGFVNACITLGTACLTVCGKVYVDKLANRANVLAAYGQVYVLIVVYKAII
jgi:hypothetical protein